MNGEFLCYTCILRPFRPADGKWLRAWFAADTAGMEQFMGHSLDSEQACVAGFNGLFTAVQQGRSQFWMVEREAVPLGFVALTEIPPTGDAGRIHIYIAPTQRRYSLDAARAAEQVFKGQGFKQLVALQQPANRAAFALAKRMGFKRPTTVILTKDLQT